MLIAQITDTHIKLPGKLAYRKVDTASMLRRCVQELLALSPQPDIVLLAARSASRGNPVATLAPKEGPVLILSPSAIIANTRRPNASRLFMEWLLGSEDTERISVEEFSVPLRANA
eukprot:gene13358-17035_t